MTSLPLIRTEYWNPGLGTVRSGATAHGESLTDVESYLVPHSQVAASSLHTAGVAEGFTVTAAPGQAGLAIAPGVALDPLGHLIALAENGFAVADPTVDPNQQVNVPTVPVDAGGVVLDTATLTGDLVLTVTWREVVGQGQLSNAPVLVHAPWLRLLPAADTADGQQVVLAGVTLDAGGLVTALAVAGRRAVGLPASRLTLGRPRAGAGPANQQLAVDQVAAAVLGALDGGGLTLDLVAEDGSTTTALALDAAGAVSLQPGGGTVGLGLGSRPARRTLHVEGSGVHTGGAGGGLSFADRSVTDFADSPANGERWVWYAEQGTARLWSGGDVLAVNPPARGGTVGIGVSGAAVRRTLHVEGSEVHSGGGGAGFSFADRTAPAFVDFPNNGERWVWYAAGGAARLWSGGDLLTVNPKVEGGGLDVARRMRVRQGGDASAGIWFFQSGAQADRAFVGMADDSHVGFFGTGVGWGLRMDTTTGSLQFAGDYGRPDGPSTLSLFGSRIGDLGNGILFIRSGGSVVTFDGPNNVGIGTANPGSKLAVVGTKTGISGAGGDGFLVSGVQGEGGIGVFANGRNTGIVAIGRNTGILAAGPQAGQFNGDVNVTGTLSKGGGGFRIDHPLDPEHRYLSHSFVESPEMLNAYRGTVTTDGDGRAVIELPDYVEALNRDFSYQLAVIGDPTGVSVAEPVAQNRFTVRTDRPGTTVSWLVLGVRADPWAEANRIQVEEEKPSAEHDLFLHPEVRGEPNTKGIHYARTNAR